MEEKLAKILKELKKIEPHPHYSLRSRSLILSHKKEPGKTGLFSFLAHFQEMRFALGAEIATMVLVAILATGYYAYEFNKNRNDLVVQANEINSSIQLKLNEIQYIIKTQSPKGTLSSDIAALLNSATDDLNKAKSDLNNNKMESAVQNIKSSESTFKDIEAKLGIPEGAATSTSATSTTDTSSSVPVHVPGPWD